MLSGCTANFCSGIDQANMTYPYEQGVTVYCDKEDIPEQYANNSYQVFTENQNLWCYIPVDSTGNFAASKSTFLVSTIIAGAKKANYNIPSQQYFVAMDQYVLESAITLAGLNTATITADEINPYTLPDPVAADKVTNKNADGTPRGVLRNWGYTKFWGDADHASLWYNWDLWTNTLKTSTAIGLGAQNCPDGDFTAYYKTQINTKLNASRSCIATKSGHYGHYGNDLDWEANIQSKTWGDAWGKGLLEGLIIYPVAWMVDTFSYGMDPALSGLGQIFALVFVTFIVRAVLMALTFKGTMDQQKMQAIQPQLAKLQAKYPNSNTNEAQKQRMAQEQMAIYKRNKINPFSSIVVMIFQFPIFIAVWGALQGSAVLSSGSVFNLRLSDTLSSVLMNFGSGWYLNSTGWWTAFVLFVLMAVAQWIAMMLPQWITKHRTKNIQRLTANPAQDKTQKTMKWVSYGMLVFTIIMGFALPAAMGVYWFIGALINMIQTAITQIIIAKKAKNKEKR